MKYATLLVIILLCLSGCSQKTEYAPFGNKELLSVLEIIEPASDDYIIQQYEYYVSTFKESTIDKTYDVLLSTVESYDDNGIPIQHTLAYTFESPEDAEAYLAAVNSDMLSLVDNHVYMKINDVNYKIDTLENLERFDDEITYISIPVLTETQSEYVAQILSHTIAECKG